MIKEFTPLPFRLARQAKPSITKGLYMAPAKGMIFESEFYTPLVATDDQQEGAAARSVVNGVRGQLRRIA